MVLHGGKAAETGSYPVLIEQKGYCRNFVLSQLSPGMEPGM
ncbi:MAG: hypothetical protein QHH06_06975 [Clostridiales bacterium]|nr:hypothetical protein [Eubacteriales bacterium]MDH7566209.1 hypothetical protein [Clostridiales bacterium]